MLEPIPFFGWFSWFEELDPLTNEQIDEIYKNSIKFVESTNSYRSYTFCKYSFAKAIEEHHGIR